MSTVPPITSVGALILRTVASPGPRSLNHSSSSALSVPVAIWLL